MKYIDLFAGIGGFHLGLKKAERFECVWANEWDKYAAQIYKKNFPETELSTKDIRAVDTNRLPEFDLLCGGFPCQAFSVAGKRKGFDDTRGTLFFEIARIIEAKRPKIVLLENVKGLLSHEKGKTFGRIIEVLGELGYWVEWQVLNSKDFGVPQNRERVFIIGHSRKEGGQKVFPIEEGSKRIDESQRETQGEGPRIWGNYPSVDTRTGSTARGQHLISNTLAQRAYKGGNQLIAYSSSQRSWGIEHRFKEGEANTLTGSTESNKSMNMVISGNSIRRLTPTECERLQGFPDGWSEGVSDTQRYKCLGNAVTVNVIEALGREINKRYFGGTSHV